MGASIKRKDKKLLKKKKIKSGVDEHLCPNENNPFEMDKFQKKSKKKIKYQKDDTDSVENNERKSALKNRKKKKNKNAKASNSTQHNSGYEQFRKIPDSIKTAQLENHFAEKNNTENKYTNRNNNNSTSLRVDDNIESQESRSGVRHHPPVTINNSNDEHKLQNLRPNRSGSISKKKHKKLRVKNFAKILKKDKEKEYKKQLHIEEEPSVVVRRPTIKRSCEETASKHLSVQSLQKQVDDVADVARNSVVVALESRHRRLKDLEERSNKLEEATFQFAKTTRDVHVKQKSQTNCCGIGSKSRILRYLCACTRPLKRKSKYNGVKDRASDDENEEAYKLISPTQKPVNSKIQQLKTASNHSLQFAPMKPSGSKQSSLTGSKLSLNSTNDNKLGKIKQSIRGSLPQLENIPKVSLLGNKRSRKYSSTSALDDKPLTKKQLKKKQEEQEKSIQELTSQFADEEMRKRAESLLRMDY